VKTGKRTFSNYFIGKKSSTNVCSPYRVEGWYEQLGGNASPLADATIDRVVHDGHEFNVDRIDQSRDISMRSMDWTSI